MGGRTVRSLSFQISDGLIFPVKNEVRKIKDVIKGKEVKPGVALGK